MYTRGVRKRGKGRPLPREEARTPQKHVAGREARRDEEGEARRFRASEDVAARDVVVVGAARRGYARSPRV